MKLGILIAGILFLVADAFVLVKMFLLVKKNKNNTVSELEKYLNPYINALSIFTILLAVCMILCIVFR